MCFQFMLIGTVPMIRLDIGIEAGGTPYEYKTRKVTYFFKPIKGYKKRK